MIQKSKRFGKRESRQAVIFSIFLGVLILAVAGFLFYTNWKIQKRRTELTARIETLKKEIQILEEKNQQLRAGISQSLSEEYLEKEARESLNLKKPGEEVVVVTLPEEEEEKPEEKNLWEKILEKFGF